jgi:tRNA(Ile)-lysidine synthase
MLRQLVAARVDAAVRIALDGAEVRRYRDAVWIVPLQPPPPRGFRARRDGRRAWRLPELRGTLRFKATIGTGIKASVLAAGTVEVRLRGGGERFQLDPGRPRRLLKSLLQENGLPPWERERLPLVYCGEKLVAVPGIGVAAEVAAAPRERGWAVTWAPFADKLPKAPKAMIK